jgi:hypothetical protein
MEAYDQPRPERPILLAVDQQLGERAALWVRPCARRSRRLARCGEHEDVEQFGAGSWAKGIQTLPQSALELVGSHGSSLRRLEDCPRRRIYGRVTVSRAGAFDGRYP